MDFPLWLIWLLRITHIVAGVFWVGGSVVMTFFIGPAVGAIGDAGPKFMADLINNRKFSNRMAMASGLTLLAGFLLYIRGGAALMGTSFGIGLGIGALFGVISFIFGITIGRTVKAMAQLGAQMQGNPSPEQRSQMQALQKRQRTVSTIATWSAIFSTVFMSIARYL